MVIFFLFLIFFAGGIEAGLVLSAVISLLMLLHFFFLTLFYTVYEDKVFHGNYAPLQNGVVVVVNDF